MAFEQRNHRYQMIFSHLSHYNQEATAFIFLSFSLNIFHDCLLSHFTLYFFLYLTALHDRESIAKPLHTKGSVCNVTETCHTLARHYNVS